MSAPGASRLEFPSESSEPELDIGVGGPELFESFVQSYDMHSLLLNQRFLASARIQVTYVTEFLVQPATLRLLLEVAFVVPCDDDYIRHFLFTECFATTESTVDFDVSKAVIKDIQKPVLSQLDYYVQIPRQERLDMLDAAMDLLDICLRDERALTVIREDRLLQRYPFTVVSRRNCFPTVRSLEHPFSANRVPFHICKAFSKLIRSLCTQQASAMLLIDVLQESTSRTISSEEADADSWNYSSAWFSNTDSPDIMGSLISFVVDSQSLLSTDSRRRMVSLLSELGFATSLCRLLITSNPDEVPADAGQMVSEVLNAILSATTCDELRLKVIKCLPSLAENVFVTEHRGIDVWRVRYTGRTLVAGVRAIIYITRSLYEDSYGKPPSIASKELKQISYLRSIFQKVLGAIKGVSHRLRMLIKEGMELERQGRDSLSTRPTDSTDLQDPNVVDTLALTVLESLTDLQNNISRSIIVDHDDDAVHLKGTIPSPDRSRPFQRRIELASGLHKQIGQFSLMQYAILETLARLLLLSADIKDFLCVSKSTGPFLSLTTGTFNLDSSCAESGLSGTFQISFPYSAIAGVGGAEAIDFKKTFCFSNGGHYPVSPLHIAECYAKNGLPDAVLLTMMAYPNCSICHFLGTRILIPMLEYNGHAPQIIHSIISETCLLRFLDLYTGQSMDDLATSFTLSTTSIGVFLVSIAANIVRLAGSIPDNRWQNRKLDHLLSLRSSLTQNSSVQQQHVPLTLDELTSSLRTSSTATNAILRKISNSLRFRTFSERVLRTSLWAHFSFHDSTDEFDSMLRQMLRLSPCSEPPPSPVKPSLHENLHILKLDDGRKSKGQAIPILPQVPLSQKTQVSAVKRYEEGCDSVTYKGHHISGSFLPTLDKRKSIIPLAGERVSNGGRLVRMASYGFLSSDPHKAENANNTSLRYVPIGMQRTQRRPVQGIPILRSHDHEKNGFRPTMAPSVQQGCPLMSIRTLRNSRSSNH